MFDELYNKVFDSDGSVRLCGRETCKKLIEACSNAYPNVNFGDLESGCMYIDNIKK